MTEEFQADEQPPGGGVLGWVIATVVVCALFWGGLYLASLERLQEELATHERKLAELEEQAATPEAERELARMERELTELKERWEATTAAELSRKLAPHGVDVIQAKPGEEAGRFILEVQGSAHRLGEALPELEAEPHAGRLPAILYWSRAKRDPVGRGFYTLEGAGRIADWQVESPPREE